jgi:hypothetical protein
MRVIVHVLGFLIHTLSDNQLPNHHHHPSLLQGLHWICRFDRFQPNIVVAKLDTLEIAEIDPLLVV